MVHTCPLKVGGANVYLCLIPDTVRCFWLTAHRLPSEWRQNRHRPPFHTPDRQRLLIPLCNWWIISLILKSERFKGGRQVILHAMITVVYLDLILSHWVCWAFDKNVTIYGFKNYSSWYKIGLKMQNKINLHLPASITISLHSYSRVNPCRINAKRKSEGPKKILRAAAYHHGQ